MLHPLLAVVGKVMKFYEILRFSIKCTMLEKIYSYSTHSSSSDWLKAIRKERRGQTQFSTKFAAKLGFMP